MPDAAWSCAGALYPKGFIAAIPFIPAAMRMLGNRSLSLHSAISPRHRELICWLGGRAESRGSHFLVV